MIVSITTLNIVALCIHGLIAALSIHDTKCNNTQDIGVQHYDTCTIAALVKMYVVAALSIAENHYNYTQFNDSQHNDTQHDITYIVSLCIHGLIAALSIQAHLS
jgi:hypothetical protein